MKIVIKKKTRTKTILALRDKIDNFIASAAKHKNSYFWEPPRSADSRRYMEFYNSFIFEVEGVEYFVKESLDVSCKNVYYYKSIFVDEKKKDLRAIKKVLAQLNEILKKRGYDDS